MLHASQGIYIYIVHLCKCVGVHMRRSVSIRNEKHGVHKCANEEMVVLQILKKADHTDSAFRCVFIRGIYFPDLCLVGSSKVNFWPDFGVGGRGSPFVTVRSSLVFPPRGPTIPYCPERGAFCPGLNVFFIFFIL